MDSHREGNPRHVHQVLSPERDNHHHHYHRIHVHVLVNRPVSTLEYITLRSILGRWNRIRQLIRHPEIMRLVCITFIEVFLW